jgi:Cysteine-rich secretory protein family
VERAPGKTERAIYTAINSGDDGIAVFLAAIAAVASFLGLPLRFAVLTFSLATGAAALKLDKRPRIIGASACALGLISTGVIWVAGIGTSSVPDVPRATAEMRLKLVSDINAVRKQNGIAPLSFDPALSSTAQQQAHYDTEANLGGLASAKFAPINRRTNMWAETTGVGPSWTEIWESIHRSIVKKATSYKNPVPTLSWSIGADTGKKAAAPVFSPDFNTIGVGYESITPDEAVITLDVTGRPKPNGNPWDNFPPDMIWIRLTDNTSHTSVGGGQNVP